MNTIRFVCISFFMMATAAADTCHEREKIILSVKNYLWEEYGPEITRHAQVYPIMGTNRARVRSYPGMQSCLGEFCIDLDSCTVSECTLKTMTSGGIQKTQGLTCWIREDNMEQFFLGF